MLQIAACPVSLTARAAPAPAVLPSIQAPICVDETATGIDVLAISQALCCPPPSSAQIFNNPHASPGDSQPLLRPGRLLPQVYTHPQPHPGQTWSNLTPKPLPGADLAVIHKANGSDTNWTVTDCHAIDFLTPIPDEIQDFRLVSVEYDQPSGTWGAAVTRKLKTCDFENDMEVKPGSSQFVMWAYGYAVKGGGFGGVYQHGSNSRGSLRAKLLDGKKRPVRTKSSPTATAAAVPAAPAPGTAAAVAEAAAAAAAAQALAREVGGAAGVPAPSLDQLVASVQGLYGSWSPDGPKCLGASCIGSDASEVGTASAGVVTSESAKGSTVVVGPIIDNKDGTKTLEMRCPADIPSDTTTYMTCYAEMPTDQ